MHPLLLHLVRQVSTLNPASILSRVFYCRMDLRRHPILEVSSHQLISVPCFISIVIHVLIRSILGPDLSQSTWKRRVLESNINLTNHVCIWTAVFSKNTGKSSKISSPCLKYNCESESEENIINGCMVHTCEPM